MLKIGDLVRITGELFFRPELHWTLAIVLENLEGDMFGSKRVAIHCLHDGGEIVVTVDKLDTVED